MPLLTLEDQVGLSLGLTAPELLAAEHWIRQGRPADEQIGRRPTAASPVLTPIVNHGKWIVMCPSCPSANRASRIDPKFMCCECWNEQTGGAWLPVAFPADADQIEEVLMARPDRHTRNWLPGETVDSLARENEHFLGAS